MVLKHEKGKCEGSAQLSIPLQLCISIFYFFLQAIPCGNRPWPAVSDLDDTDLETQEIGLTREWAVGKAPVTRKDR